MAGLQNRFRPAPHVFFLQLRLKGQWLPGHVLLLVDHQHTRQIIKTPLKTSAPKYTNIRLAKAIQVPKCNVNYTQSEGKAKLNGKKCECVILLAEGETLGPRFQSTTLRNMPLYPGECLLVHVLICLIILLLTFCYCIFQEFHFTTPSLYVFILQVCLLLRTYCWAFPLFILFDCYFNR